MKTGGLKCLIVIAFYFVNIKSDKITKLNVATTWYM